MSGQSEDAVDGEILVVDGSADGENIADRFKSWREAGGVAGPRLDPLRKAERRPSSLRLAISAKCFDCVGRGVDPGWRWLIGNCDAPCPLVPVRPYRHLAGTKQPAAMGGLE